MPLTQIQLEGITFGRVACLARCNGAKVVAFRSDESSVDEFRKHVISCSHSEDSHVIVSYHRTPLNQVVNHSSFLSIHDSCLVNFDQAYFTLYIVG